MATSTNGRTCSGAPDSNKGSPEEKFLAAEAGKGGLDAIDSLVRASSGVKYSAMALRSRRYVLAKYFYRVQRRITSNETVELGRRVFRMLCKVSLDATCRAPVTEVYRAIRHLLPTALVGAFVACLPWSFARADDAILGPESLGATPAMAFATHQARASELARFFALTHPLRVEPAPADEDNTIALIAHLQAASDNPTFAVAGQEPSRTLALKVLHSLNQGDGQVGTSYDEGLIGSRKGDYDMALKGLMVVAFRYPDIVTQADVDYILDTLLPTHLRGPHDVSRESYVVGGSLLGKRVPETENHLLMMESSRYLANQLLYRRLHNPTFDNNANHLTEWLLNYLNVIARHDFMEFNARPYSRLSVHALLNLNEFASDESIRTASQNILDYLMMKFAVSSNRQRRVSPFRRLRENINSVSHLNDITHEDFGGDPMMGYFSTYTGFIGADGKPVNRYPGGWTFESVIAGLSLYRPPPAAYILGMQNDIPAYQHRFYHGARPKPSGLGEQPDGGLEIYSRSPHFLLTAGGIFLNSGYGSDELAGYKQVAAPQQLTLMPTMADVNFADLIRFEAYPDYHVAVTTAVDRGFACGANLRPSERVVLKDTSDFGPSMSVYDNRLLYGWAGTGDHNLNVATVATTSTMGFDGVEGLVNKVSLSQSADRGVAFATHAGRLYAAWRGQGNSNLYLMVSGDGGATWRGRTMLRDTSEFAPALLSHNGRLLLAWTGIGDGKLNVARVTLIGNTAGGFDIEGIEAKVTLADSSDAGPALASTGGRALLAWRGTGEGRLNLIASADGAIWASKTTFADSSEKGPALAVHNHALFLAWTGKGEGRLNVARVPLIGNTAGAFSIGPLEGKVVLGDTSDATPSVVSFQDHLLISWKDAGSQRLVMRTSADGNFAPKPRWLFADLGKMGFYVAAYRTPPAHPAQLASPPDNLALLYAMEADGMTFDQFRTQIVSANANLPTELEYGGRYSFNTPDHRRFGCWLAPSGNKYTSRAALQDDPRSTDDLTKLPLVEGPYLRAPGGHDGIIEVRTPGCENAPLVLDSHDPAHPSRRDNRATCPAPWIARAQALSSIADTTAASSRLLQQRALRDAIKIYRDLAATDPTRYARDVATSSARAIAAIGVDYSVSTTQMSDWLNNATYTPYPALSDALLTTLNGHKLRRPVYLDVIAYNYEHSPGVTSPRKAEEVDMNRLKAAVVEGYGLRYGVRPPSFGEIVE